MMRNRDRGAVPPGPHPAPLQSNAHIVPTSRCSLQPLSGARANLRPASLLRPRDWRQIP